MAMATSTILGLLAASAAAASALKKKSDGSSTTDTTDTSGTSSPEMLAAINSMMARQKAQDPLFQALTNLGVNLLPNSAYKKYPGRTYGEIFPYGTDVTPNTPTGEKAVPRPQTPVPTVPGQRQPPQLPPDSRDPGSRAIPRPKTFDQGY